MIDTIKVQFKCKHSPFGNRKTETRNGIKKSFCGAVLVHADKQATYGRLHVCSKRNGTIIEVEGSIAKFFQGFNAFGSSSIKKLTFEIFKSITSTLNIKPTERELKRVRSGHVRLMRIDIAKYAVCDSREAVRNTIFRLRQALAMDRRSNTAFYKDETCYWHKGSSHWSFCFYDKYEQLTKDKGFLTHPHRDAILKATRRLIRVELVLRSKYLKDKQLTSVRNWDVACIESEFEKCLRTIHALTEEPIPKRMGLDQLPPCTPLHKMAFVLAKRGFPLETLYGKDGYRKLCKSFHKKIGLNIETVSSQPESAPPATLRNLFSPGALRSLRPKQIRNMGLLFPYVLEREAVTLQ